MDSRWRPFYGWWVLLSAAAVLMIGFALSAYALPVFYPELINAFHWPRANVALGGSLKTLLVGLLAPLNGWIIDRRGPKTILLAGVAALGISLAFLSGIHSLWQYYVLCVFLGLGGSWTHHFPIHLLIANWFAKRRGLVIGFLTAVAGVGNSLIPIWSATLIKRDGWREALLILPLILIVPFLAVAFLVRNRPEEKGLHADGGLESAPAIIHPHRAGGSGAASGLGWTALKTGAFWVLAGVFLLPAWAQLSVWQHLVLFLRDEGFKPTVAAYFLSLFLLASSVGRFFGGPLSDRISADYATLIGVVLIGFSVVALLSSRSLAAIYLGVIVLGLGEGSTVTCRPLLVFGHYGASGVGKLYGVATAMMTVGAFVGPVLAGYIHDQTHSYHLAFLLALALVCISIVLVVLLKRTEFPTQNEERKGILRFRGSGIWVGDLKAMRRIRH